MPRSSWDLSEIPTRRILKYSSTTSSPSSWSASVCGGSARACMRPKRYDDHPCRRTHRARLERRYRYRHTQRRPHAPFEKSAELCVRIAHCVVGRGTFPPLMGDVGVLLRDVLRPRGQPVFSWASPAGGPRLFYGDERTYLPRASVPRC